MKDRDNHTVALIGNPNVGKSTLFTALTGTRQKVANFPGVTVEAKLGTARFENTEITIVDLPGTYSLSARSPDERVAIDALLGRLDETPAPDGVILILDASSLDRNLYLGTQVLEFGLPTVVALSMHDVAQARGIQIDRDKLAQALGVPVVVVNAPTGDGIEELKATLHRALHHPGKPLELPFPAEFNAAVDEVHTTLCDLSVQLGYKPTRSEALRVLVDSGGPLVEEMNRVGGDAFRQRIQELRVKAAPGRSMAMVESQGRYELIGRWLQGARVAPASEGRTLTDKVDSILTHKLWGSLVFIAVMGLIFQSIYTWSGPLMDAIEGGIGALGEQVVSLLPEDSAMLRSLVADGIFAGVGGVLVFLPQILILFLFIALLEDLGYMSRAAFLMDRLMSRFGLSGRAFVPLLSSFACAIPGIMGARVIEDRNTRLTTVFLAPFMSCSARLPVYTVMIGAFVPAQSVLGFLSLQGLVLFIMYWVGALFAIPTALVLKRGILKSKVTPFLMEMPSYKLPRARNVARVLYDRGGSFVRRAGTIIFAVTIIVWALLWFPRNDEVSAQHEIARQERNDIHATLAERVAREYDPDLTAESIRSDENVAAALVQVAAMHAARQEAREADAEALGHDSEAMAQANKAETAAWSAALDELSRVHGKAGRAALELYFSDQQHESAVGEIDNAEAAEHARNSFLGRVGRLIEPVVEPLGWDWRIGMAAVASFPAREVVIATLGTIFSLGAADEETEGLAETLQNARREDGSLLFTLATALSVMVFFALCAQCAATLAVMRRETNSWKWPLASFVYMTSLAYVAALVTYQVASAVGG